MENLLVEITEDQIENAIKNIECNQPEIYWDYRETLSDKDITGILNGHYDDVMNNLMDYNTDYVWDLENEYAKQALGDAGIDEDEVDEDAWDDAMDRIKEHIEIDWNIRQLFNNSRAYIGIELEADIVINSPKYIEYEDYKAALGLLYINPRKFSDYFETAYKFPNYPWRDGKEKCKPEEFFNAVYNTFYTGRLVIMLGYRLDLKDFVDNLDHMKTKGFTLKAGARVIPHDFMNGSSGLSFFTTQDIKIKPDMIHDIYNDGDYKYGIQACCGYCTDAWRSRIELDTGVTL